MTDVSADEWLRRYNAATSDDERKAVREQLAEARRLAHQELLAASAADDALARLIAAIDKLAAP